MLVGLSEFGIRCLISGTKRGIPTCVVATERTAMRLCLVMMTAGLFGIASAASANAQSRRPLAADEFIQASSQMNTGERLVGRTTPGSGSQEMITVAPRPVGNSIDWFLSDQSRFDAAPGSIQHLSVSGGEPTPNCQSRLSSDGVSIFRDQPQRDSNGTKLQLPPGHYGWLSSSSQYGSQHSSGSAAGTSRQVVRTWHNSRRTAD